MVPSGTAPNWQSMRQTRCHSMGEDLVEVEVQVQVQATALDQDQDLDLGRVLCNRRLRCNSS